MTDNRLCIRPEDNIMIGAQIIMRYLGIKSLVTLYDWVEVYGLPAIKLPNGQWMSSMTAIDQWIFMAAEMDNKNRTKSRGHNSSAELALARAQRRVDKLNEVQKERTWWPKDD